MSKLTPTEFQFADAYSVGERVASNYTKRAGIIADWPSDSPPLVGAVWIKWDDRTQSHAWRHQIHRAVAGGRQK